MITLNDIVIAFNKVKLEAIMIGNAAALQQGAPVTTLDYDFYIRDYNVSKEKIKQLVSLLNADMIIPDRTVTTQIIIENPAENLYIDLIDKPTGMKHFVATRSRSKQLPFDKNNYVWVASLEDIIASKKKLARDKDLAILPILEKALKCKNKEL